jgi:hypothetical protein
VLRMQDNNMTMIVNLFDLCMKCPSSFIADEIYLYILPKIQLVGIHE